MALEGILAHKREEIARRKAERSLESVLASCVPSDRSLTGALAARSPGFILEIKFASPSAGVIRPGQDLDPILASYGRHADAVSVLTDERFFGGSLARLAEARAGVEQPILCKDFILEPFQVAEARLFGADAVLLILAAVDDSTWRACADLAARLRMAVLTEVHDETEAARAVALGADIIGVNNRDLVTLAVDSGTVPRLAPRLPADRLVVAESGIASRADVTALRPFADAFLVGSALMREVDLDAAVRNLVYGVTKVCGLTREDDARAAQRAGATHGGLVFATGSPRLVSVAQADPVRRAAPLEWVGVFADQPPEEIATTARRLALSAVQLHGHENPAEVARVGTLVPPGCAVWKAVRVRDRVPLRAETGGDRLLLDGARPAPESRHSIAGPAAVHLGGTGQRFDWALLDGYPERSDVLLAGGLTAENAAHAAALGVYGLDVSSGVESTPGRKDPARLAAFFRARRHLPGRGDRSP